MTTVFADLALARQQSIGMFEGVTAFEKKNDKSLAVDPKIEVDPVVAMYEAIEKNALTNMRAIGMGALLAWADMGEPTADDFDITAQGVADIDEDGEMTDDEEDAYNDILFAMAQGLMFIGVSSSIVQDLIDGDDKAASKAYVALATKLEAMDESEDELIAEFSVEEQGMMEGKVKVVRDGQFKWIKKPLKKRRMSAAQRAALKKARTKSNSAGARAKRKKSMRKRG